MRQEPWCQHHYSYQMVVSVQGTQIARLKRELRDAQDALDVLKKAIGILGND